MRSWGLEIVILLSLGKHLVTEVLEMEGMSMRAEVWEWRHGSRSRKVDSSTSPSRRRGKEVQLPVLLSLDRQGGKEKRGEAWVAYSKRRRRRVAIE